MSASVPPRSRSGDNDGGDVDGDSSGLMPGDAEDAREILDLTEVTVASRALQVVAELGIADTFGDMPRSVAEIAEETSTDPAVLHSVLRLLSGYGIFTESRPDRFALTRRGELLRTNHPRSMRSIVRLYHFCQPIVGEIEHSLRYGEPAAEKVLGEPLFEYLRAHPESGAVFDSAMAELSRSQSAAIVDAYDFSGFRRIVDVGGGNGTLLATILRNHPEATGVLLDRPHVTRHAEQVRAAAGLQGRMEIVAGDFFEKVPEHGDFYILKSTLHDWPDDQAVRILRTCRRAIPPHGRLVLFERLQKADNRPSQAKTMDLLMFLVHGGRERTQQDFERLFVDSGFRLSQVVQAGTALYAVEAVPVRVPA